MKIVIDTSVLVSALITKESDARNVLRLALEKKIYPQLSQALFLEYEDVTKRTKIQKLCPLSSGEQEQLVDALLSVSTWNEIYYMWRLNLRDESDNFLIELAVASGASHIVTYNIKDFNTSELRFSHKVMTPEQFMKEKK